MAKQLLSNCGVIFLDTGVIIDLLKIDISKNSQEVQDRINQIRIFFNSMRKNKQDCAFQTSSINIAEIFHLDSRHDSVMGAITRIITAPNFEVISFDYTSSLYHNKEFGAMLGNKEMAKLRQLVNYPASQYANIEDRIRKDFMIATVAKMYGSDITLTTDVGFKALYDSISVNCHLFTGNKSDFVYSQDELTIYEFQ